VVRDVRMLRCIEACVNSVADSAATATATAAVAAVFKHLTQVSGLSACCSRSLGLSLPPRFALRSSRYRSFIFGKSWL
jgi:hypothetical protein